MDYSKLFIDRGFRRISDIYWRKEESIGITIEIEKSNILGNTSFEITRCFTKNLIGRSHIFIGSIKTEDELNTLFRMLHI